MLDIRGSGQTYSVCHNGRPVTRAFWSITAAEHALDRIDTATRQRRRPCLCCGKTFLSKGPHNRLCTPCRKES